MAKMQWFRLGDKLYTPCFDGYGKLETVEVFTVPGWDEDLVFEGECDSVPAEAVGYAEQWEAWPEGGWGSPC